jgi:DNA-binding NarL/FixJ family response regulator
MPIKILMIDDHPLQIDGYKTVLSLHHFGDEIEITTANNCEEAYGIITNTVNTIFFDLIFLDFSLPPYPEKNIYNGEDLALELKKYLPNSKILILTSHWESFVLYNLIKKTDPAGLLVKSDFNGDELLDAVSLILKGENYYSHTAKESLKSLASRQDFLDTIDKQIITLLSQGYKTDTLVSELQLSKSTIEKRKVKIKDNLGINKGNDEDIIRECRRLGFI